MELNSLKQKNKIIFLFPYAPTDWEYQKFGFNFFIKKNIQFYIYDMSAIISTRHVKTDRPLKDKYIKKILSYSHFEQALKDLNNSAVFIDGINGLKGFQWQGQKIFKLFKKYHIEYFVVEVGSLPILAASPRRSMIIIFKKALQFRKLFIFLKWKIGRWIVHLQWNYFNLYQLPIKIFSPHSEVLQRYLEHYNISPNNVIPIHSFDYDRYLLALAKKTIIKGLPNQYAVFLDQMLAQHSDFGKSVSFNPVSAEKYIPSLNMFFDKVEEKLGMPVIIAASPKANYEPCPDIYGKRAIIQGKTLELIADSSLVFMHSSTAVSFAILYDKPILVLKTNEMEFALGYTNFLYKMAFALGLEPLCIDDMATLNRFNWNEYTTWPRKYDNYKYKYVMSRNAENKITWDVVIDYFLNTYAM